MKNLLIVLILSVAVVFGIIYLVNKNEEARIERYVELSSREVALLCTTDMATEYHIHPLLKIYINKKEVIVPANTGITNNCMNSIHTHEEPNVLHVEAPVQKDFTLGDFFAVWGQPFDSEHLVDFVADKKGEIAMTVNGVVVDTFENTILKDGDKIVVEARDL